MDLRPKKPRVHNVLSYFQIENHQSRIGANAFIAGSRLFNEFAELAYQVVERITEAKHQIQIPDPLEGLRPELILNKEEQVA